MPRRSTREEFIQKSIAIHSDKYNYDKVQYINSSTKVCIVCSEHGDFLQTPGGHLNGDGCMKCGRKRTADSHRMTKEEFAESSRKVHDNKYTYSKVKYTNSLIKVCIDCPKHGEFWQVPSDHLGGHGCERCGHESASDIRRVTVEEFIKKSRNAHGDKYDYSKVRYTNNRTKVCIICPEHGEFMQTPDNHVNEVGCPNCLNKSEAKCRKILQDLTGCNFPSVWPDFLVYTSGKCLQLDGYCEELKLAFEYNGIQHYQYQKFFHRGSEDRLAIQQERDQFKYDRLAELGIELIIIPCTCDTDEKKEDFIRQELTRISDEREATNCVV